MLYPIIHIRLTGSLCDINLLYLIVFFTATSEELSLSLRENQRIFLMVTNLNAMCSHLVGIEHAYVCQ